MFDGAPSESTVGLDLSSELIELGYELFRDQDQLCTEFIIEDFVRDTPKLDRLKTKISFVNCGFFLHLWDWDGQVDAAKRIVDFVVKEKGTVITGVSAGSDVPGVWVDNPHRGRPMYLHDNQTFALLWRQIGRETSTKWMVHSALEAAEGFDQLKQDDVPLKLQSWAVEYVEPTKSSL